MFPKIISPINSLTWGQLLGDSSLRQTSFLPWRIWYYPLTTFLGQTQYSPHINSLRWVLLLSHFTSEETEDTGLASGWAKIWTQIFLALKVLPVPSHDTHPVPSILDLSPAWSRHDYQDRSGHGWPVTMTPITATSKEQEIIIRESNVPRQLVPAHKGRQHYYFKNPPGHTKATFVTVEDGTRMVITSPSTDCVGRSNGKTHLGPSLVCYSL